MTLVKLLFSGAFILLSIGVQPRATGWRGIVPLHSTRADVERVIGKPNFKHDVYDLKDERVSIIYSGDPCATGSQGDWNVRRDTVIQISVAPKKKLRLSDLPIDLSRYERVRDPLVEVHTYYTNKEEGIRYDVFEGGGEDGGKIISVDYGPKTADAHLRCPVAANRPCDKVDR